jgi:hypothetical protein
MYHFFNDDDIPIVTEEEVIAILAEMDTSKSDCKGDIPAKILKAFASKLGKPVSDVINTSIRQGCFPDIFKLELVTPVPKVFPPNQEGMSIQHYLVKFIDRVLQTIDSDSKSEAVAVLATLVDWKQAFPRQCPKLGVESYLKNGVRPALIPLLINYFQGRKIKVKWHGELSSERELKGGGPQGSTFGIWEYLSQSNDNADCISEINEKAYDQGSRKNKQSGLELFQAQFMIRLALQDLQALFFGIEWFSYLNTSSPSNQTS